LREGEGLGELLWGVLLTGVRVSRWKAVASHRKMLIENLNNNGFISGDSVSYVQCSWAAGRRCSYSPWTPYKGKRWDLRNFLYCKTGHKSIIFFVRQTAISDTPLYILNNLLVLVSGTDYKLSKLFDQIRSYCVLPVGILSHIIL
jgi:hypothetical protein